LSIPAALYQPGDAEISRQPPGFIIRRAIQPGSGAASQTITVWEGDQSRHLIIQTLNVRVTITPDGASATKLEIVRLEALDMSAGTLATVIWEAIYTGSPAGVGLYNPAIPGLATGWVLPAAGPAQAANFDLTIGLRDAVIPNGLQLRFVLGTTGGTPVNLGGTAHLVGLAIPVGRLPR
jgi:hypothetical protein